MARESSVLDAISTSGLTKRYGGTTAVASLDWVVPAGGITGLLGPNGAGKTTTLKMLFGLAGPSGGDARVLGSDVVTQGSAVRRDAAFIPAEKEAPGWMRVAKLAAEYARLFPDWDAAVLDRLVRRWAIPLDARVSTLSRGMRAKMLVAMALSRRPHLLVLDEPTDGIDPAGIEDFLTLLIDLASAEGAAVVLSTHRLEEVERVCDRVTILSKGRLAVDGDSDTLRSEWRAVTARAGITPAALHAIASKGEAFSSWKEDELVHIVVRRNVDSVVAELKTAGAGAVQVSPMSLREIYLVVTNYAEANGNAATPPVHDRLA